MLTDMDAVNEYADVTINGVNVGTCGDVSLCAGCCDWYTCNISPSQFFSTSSTLSVSLQYSDQVMESVATCSVDGRNWAAVARITLTSEGLFTEFFKNLDFQ